MAILTKAQLQADNSASFADNNTQAITPAILRSYNANIIDTLVDSLDTGSFATTSSFNTASLNTATASLFTSASLGLTTASVNVNVITFTKGNGTTFDISVTASGSVATGTVSGSAQIVQLGFLQTSSFNAYTASQSTASLVTSITELNSFTSSQLTINTAIGASTSSLNTFSGSQITKNSTLATYTASVDTKFTAVGASTSSLNTFSGSQITKNSTLATYTASVDTKFTAVGVSTSSLNTATSSLFTSASRAITTASVSSSTITFTKGDGTTFPINVSVTSNVFPFSGSAVITGSLEVSGSAADIFIGGGRGIRISQSLSTNTDGITVTAVSPGAYSTTPSALKSFGDPYNRIISAPDTGTVPTSTNTFNITKVHNAGVLGEWTLVGYGTDIGNSGNAGGIYIGKGQSDSTTTSRHTIGFNYIPPTTSDAYNFVFAGQSAYDIAQGGARTFIKGHLFVSQSFTASLQNGYAWVGNSTGYNVQVATSSFAGTAINTGSFVTTSSFNDYTASQSTASLVTSINNLNTFTQSAQVSINALNSATSSYVTESETGSFATTGSNTFVGNQTITGNITAFSASFTYLQTIFESSSVIYSSGSNIFGDELSDTQTLSGSVKVQGSLTVNGTPVQTSSVDISALNSATASLFTSASLALTTASFDNGTRNLTFTKGDNQTFSVNIPDVSGSTLPSGVISGSAQITSLGFVSSSVTASSLVTASFAGNTLTFTKGDASTFGIVIPDNSGSTGNFATTGSNVFVGNQTITGSLFVSGNINMVNGADIVTHHVKAPAINGVEIQTNTGGVVALFGAGGGLGSTFYGQINATSISASTINGLGDPLAFSTSVDSRLDQLEVATGSLFSSASLGLTTASFSGNTLTFRKGDGTTFGVVIPDVSGSTINTGSFATTGSNAFFGTNTFSGAIAFTGSAPTILSSSFSGSIITNLTDTYTDVAAVNQIVTLTSASYAALASGSLTNPNTLYIVSGSTSGSITGATLGSNTFSGSQIFTGSVQGNVVSMSITSNTASMNLSLGNYFTLTLADTATTHISASNVQPGVSATLVITTGTNSSASLAPTMLQPSGSSYSATNGSSKKDVLSIVAVASGVPFVVSTKNMI